MVFQDRVSALDPARNRSISYVAQPTALLRLEVSTATQSGRRSPSKPRFPPPSGRRCGIVFRFSEGKYYLIRANALEDNFRFYYYDNGRRMLSSASVRAPALGKADSVTAFDELTVLVP